MTENKQDASVEPGGEQEIPVAKLSVMNRLGSVGVDGIEQRLRRMDNDDVDVEAELVKGGYVTDASLQREFRDVERTGGRVRLSSVPHGYAVVLFSMHSANNAAAMMLSNTVDDVSAVSEEMARSALTELSGMMAMGFLDTWANRFDERIDLGEPTPVHNTEREIVGQTATTSDDLGVYVTSRLRFPDQDITAQLYLFPDTETFVELVRRVDIGMIE